MIIKRTGVKEMLEYWDGRYKGFVESVSARVESGEEECWLLYDEEAGKWIGELHIRWNNPDYPDEANGVDTASLEAFRIDKAYRGRHLGTQLMRHCLDCIRERGFTRATIGADDDDPKLGPMYQNWGFTHRIRDEVFDYVEDGKVIRDTYVLYANEDVQHTGLGR